jgi:hypothetical protein
MHNGIKYTFIFSIGAALGAFATWQYLKPKYERMVQDEVNEFKKDWSGRDAETTECPDEESRIMDLDELERKKDELHEMFEQYGNIIENNKYAEVLKKGGSNSMKDDAPYVISPLKFAEQDDDYDVISLTYHADGVLVDDKGELIENSEFIVGTEFPEHFGEYTEDPDTVYVRNERLMTDYEIQRDLDTYASLNPMDDE